MKISEEPNDLGGKSSLDKLLKMLKSETELWQRDDHPTVPANITPVPRMTPDNVLILRQLPASPPVSFVADVPTVSELPMSFEVQTSNEQEIPTAPERPMSALMKAIIEPDIYTSPVDRDRAIDLRWAMRDIKNNRLKWSPVNENDLQTLIELGLVEIRNDQKPALTNAGISAIT